MIRVRPRLCRSKDVPRPADSTSPAQGGAHQAWLRQRMKAPRPPLRACGRGDDAPRAEIRQTPWSRWAAKGPAPAVAKASSASLR
eukprot:5071038-Pyramimonas_sp.AAC.1